MACRNLSNGDAMQVYSWVCTRVVCPSHAQGLLASQVHQDQMCMVLPLMMSKAARCDLKRTVCCMRLYVAYSAIQLNHGLNSCCADAYLAGSIAVGRVAVRLMTMDKSLCNIQSGLQAANNSWMAWTSIDNKLHSKCLL